MLAGAAALLFVVQQFGDAIVPPTPPASDGPALGAAQSTGALTQVIIALVAVIALGRLLGWLLKFLGQPPVMGEVLAGIALGPSLLGAFSPAASGFVLSPAAAPTLSVIAQLAVILYMFLVGLELDVGQLRGRRQAAVAIAHTSMVVPFSLGIVLALVLYPRLSTGDVPFSVFALFVGVSLSVTAFPVLARILTDRGLHKSPLGVLALTCAAAGDATAWCLLALVVGIAQSELGGALTVVIAALAFMAVMLLAVRPLLARWKWLLAGETLDQSRLAVVLVGVLLAALATDAIGIHAIFGAFLLGTIIPHESLVARELPGKLHDVVAVLLLPAFFAFTGMRTQIGLVAGWEQWLLCGIIIVVATLGKFGGTFAAARLSGLAWRESTALGLLMNTRGLMELIVLNIGLDLGVISPTLFAMLVIMALATTLATGPALTLVWCSKHAGESLSAAGPSNKLN